MSRLCKQIDAQVKAFLGRPIRLQGLLAAFLPDRDRGKPCGSPSHTTGHTGPYGGQAERGQICVRERDVEGRAGSDPAIEGYEAFDPIFVPSMFDSLEVKVRYPA